MLPHVGNAWRWIYIAISQTFSRCQDRKSARQSKPINPFVANLLTNSPVQLGTAYWEGAALLRVACHQSGSLFYSLFFLVQAGNTKKMLSNMLCTKVTLLVAIALGGASCLDWAHAHQDNSGGTLERMVSMRTITPSRLLSKTID